jgi:hypothetical protein
VSTRTTTSVESLLHGHVGRSLQQWQNTRSESNAQVLTAPIVQNKEALAELPANWIMRYASTAMPLATAYARTGERDLSLTVAKNVVLFKG